MSQGAEASAGQGSDAVTSQEPSPPLHTPWTFWIGPKGNPDDFERNLKKIYTFDNAVDFWAVYNRIPSLSSMEEGTAVYLMRDQRRPVWEDPENREGGTWVVKLKKEYSSFAWQEILLAAIGEQFLNVFKETDSLVGLSVSVRDKEDTIKMWNQKSELGDPETPALEQKLRDLIVFDPRRGGDRVFYKAHQSHRKYDTSGGRGFGDRRF
ncbi:unnamed protein product [Cyprideis torosa]|uniref:Uncharacterized protein n=1 Tax=Cyprideis torosa TaxID=163714 RepID=A0A7R8W2I4_9CRUS|nr:unnamed protein product [Cyprideis torosa]CAG0881989.1 unnamed protein product [Cyprideis torosa]